MNIKDTDPAWVRLIAGLLPEARMVVAAGYFCLAYRLLWMIEVKPELLSNAAFMTVATLVIGTGGLGIVGSFFFGGTKSGSEVMKSQSDTIAGKDTTATK